VSPEGTSSTITLHVLLTTQYTPRLDEPNDKNIEIPCSGGRTNMKEKKDQAQGTKKRQLDAAVQKGERKGRKSS